MPPKRNTGKQVELKIDFGSGSAFVPPVPTRQVFVAKQPTAQEESKVAQPKLPEAIKPEQPKRQVIDTTKDPEPEQQRQPKVQQPQNQPKKAKKPQPTEKAVEDSMQPVIAEALKQDLLQQLDASQVPKQSFASAVESIYSQVGQVLGGCPPVPPQALPSHQFGDQQISPLIPQMTFELVGEQFQAKLSHFQPLPKSEVLKSLLETEDKILSPDMLDHLFEFEIEPLKRQAACHSIKFDTDEMMKPKLDYVYQGIANTLISCTALGLEYQESQMDHDLFTGEAIGVIYRDQSKVEVGGCLNDETEINELLAQACDPFGSCEESQDCETQFQLFLTEFKNLNKQQEEQEEHQKVLKLIQEQQSQKEQELSAPVDTQQETREGEEECKEPQYVDEIDEIVGASHQFESAISQIDSNKTVQAEPSRFNLAVVAKERIQVSTDLSQLAEGSSEKWVVKDTVSMKDFKKLIPDPAINYDFELDDFQKRAIYRLEQGHNVMVAAHTSAGKTAVAEYAIALSRRHMTKTIYTSPIKTLSNQKYRDFKLKFGDVGVLTGDVQLNPNAACLIMTTEVLQSMLYNSDAAVQDVEWVIFDEVHYINDPERGSVWEEVIMKLPDTCAIIMLSATVPNYLEFANWVGRTKQKKVYVQYTDKRPVPLQHHLMLEGRLNLIKDQELPVDFNLLKKCSAQRFAIRNSQQDDNHKKEPPKDPKNEEQKVKKIDFKEKAIKAKEGAMKKMLAKNTGGGGQGPNSGQGKKKSNSFQKTIESIAQQKLLPAIIFAFSRAGTFQYAEGLDPTMDFTDGYTKGLIRKFIKQKLQRLDEADRDLPQIRQLTGLLIRGIGVHHAGLLQLLKEIVEILFSDGYLKIVFATSTFAIGLNLPARCVVFTEMQKFNGEARSIIEASEYLQMAGRAGRRGKDDRGFSIICADPDLGKIPSNQEMLDLLDSKGVELASQLKIDYRTCLNILKQQQRDFGSMLQSSFFANEDMSIKLANVKQKKHVEPLFEKTKTINCIKGVPESIQKVYNYIDQLWAANAKLFAKMVPSVMQIVEITTAKHILKPVVVLRVTNNRCLCLFSQKVAESWPLAYDERKAEESPEDLRRKQPVKQIATEQGIYNYEYVTVYFDMISKFYTNQIEVTKLQFVQSNQLNEKQLKLIVKEFHNIRVLKEEENKTKKLEATRANQQEIIAQIKETKCWGCDYLSYHLTQLEVHSNYKTQMEGIDKILEGGVDEKVNDFNNRNAILMEYKVIDAELNLTFRGKVHEIAQDIILAEFFFTGMIGQLTDCELLAILSFFCIQEKAGSKIENCAKQYSENFTKAYNFIIEGTEKLLELEAQKGIVTKENTMEKRVNLKFYEMVYDWADQKSFADVIEAGGVEEGIVVKMFMSCSKQRERLQKMATFVGDNSLAERLLKMDELINRGIVKIQSLYLEVQQEQL